jgi:hypothetical protein
VDSNQCSTCDHIIYGIEFVRQLLAAPPKKATAASGRSRVGGRWTGDGDLLDALPRYFSDDDDLRTVTRFQLGLLHIDDFTQYALLPIDTYERSRALSIIVPKRYGASGNLNLCALLMLPFENNAIPRSLQTGVTDYRLLIQLLQLGGPHIAARVISKDVLGGKGFVSLWDAYFRPESISDKYTTDESEADGIPSITHWTLEGLQSDPLVQLLLYGSVPFHDTYGDKRYNLLENVVSSSMPVQYIEFLVSHDAGTLLSDAFRQSHGMHLVPMYSSEPLIANGPDMISMYMTPLSDEILTANTDLVNDPKQLAEWRRDGCVPGTIVECYVCARVRVTFSSLSSHSTLSASAYS